MNHTQLKTLTAEIEATYEYGKRKFELEMVKCFNGRKTTLTVYAKNFYKDDDIGYKCPKIEYDGEKAQYVSGIVLGANLPVDNHELEALAITAEFNQYLKAVFTQPLGWTC